MKLKQYERGKIFCDEIARVGGGAALRHLFSAPEALPTLAEIEDPAAWLRRSPGSAGVHCGSADSENLTHGQVVRYISATLRLLALGAR